MSRNASQGKQLPNGNYRIVMSPDNKMFYTIKVLGINPLEIFIKLANAFFGKGRPVISHNNISDAISPIQVLMGKKIGENLLLRNSLSSSKRHHLIPECALQSYGGYRNSWQGSYRLP